jgi:hypothetical protein
LVRQKPADSAASFASELIGAIQQDKCVSVLLKVRVGLTTPSDRQPKISLQHPRDNFGANPNRLARIAHNVKAGNRP